MSKINKFFKAMKHFIKNNKLLIVIFFLTLAYKVAIHLTYNSNFADLNYTDRTAYNFVRGLGFFSDVDHFDFLRQHFYPWLFPIGYLYKIVATKAWPFLITATMVSLIAYPIIKIAKEKLNKKEVFFFSVFLVSSYFFRHLMFEDIHGELFMTALLSWIIYYLSKNNDKQAILLTLLLPLCKENFISVAGAVSIYFFFKGKRKASLFVAVYSIIATLLIFKVYYVLINNGSYMFMDRYAASSKIQLFMSLFNADKFAYLLILLLPYGLLPLFSSYTLLGLGIVTQNLLSTYLGQYTFYTHYNFPLIPVIAVSSIFGYLRLKQNKRFMRFLVITLSFFFVINILAFIFLEARYFTNPRPYISETRHIRKIVGPIASIEACEWSMMHYSYRPKWDRIRNCEAQYVILKRPIMVTPEEYKKLPISKKISALFYGEIQGQGLRDEFNKTLVNVKKTHTLIWDQNLLLFKKKESMP